MDSKAVVIFILLGTTILGFIKIIYDIRKYINDYNFVNGYVLKLNNLLNNSISNEEYTYLLNNATKLSMALGIYGYIDLKPPFANYIYKNYNIINTILNYTGSFMNDELVLALKTIQIYLGACDNTIEGLKKKLRNPLKVFAEGFRFILNTPLFIFNSLGLISDKKYYKIKGNYFYHLIQNIFGLLGLVSAIITIVQGKEIMFNTYYKIIRDIASIF